MLLCGVDRDEARRRVQPKINAMIGAWKKRQTSRVKLAGRIDGQRKCRRQAPAGVEWITVLRSLVLSDSAGNGSVRRQIPSCQSGYGYRD